MRRRVLIRGLLFLFALLLVGCASGTTGLSSLGREVHVLPLRRQPVEQLRQDDGECERWTRATKGPQEPLPAAELRYAACMVARGYRTDVGQAHVSSTPDRTLDIVLTEWRGCRVDKVIREPWTDVPFADAFKGQKALECLSGRGYVVVDIPHMVDSPSGLPSPMRQP